MNRRTKRLNKFSTNPESLKYSEIESILLSNGFKKIPAKGSHIKFKHHKLQADLIIPIHNNDCKNFYKKLALQALRNAQQ